MTDTSDERIAAIRAAAISWSPLVGSLVIEAIEDLGAKIDELEDEIVELKDALECARDD